MYIQLYLFTIKYSHWRAIDMVKYIPYLILFVYNYMSVFTHAYVNNKINYCIKNICNLSLEIQGPFTHRRMHVNVLSD